ncbi:thiamine-phosphate kinase [Desulfurobacterium sp.]
MKEFRLIEQISRLFTKIEGGIGIGDDAAAIKTENEYQLITVDTLTENTHYRKKWTKLLPDLYKTLGWKLLAVSVSDIASMGGTPLTAVVSFTLKKNFEEKEIVELAKGLSSACNYFNVTLAGGDTVRGNCEVFSLTLTGKSTKVMTRDAAKPGEFVAVTGPCGDAAAGLKILESGKINTNDERKLVRKFLLPHPSVETAKKLAVSGVKCCMDNSDGLLFTCREIALKSGVSINIHSERVPMSKEIKTVFKDEALNLALYGGEDFNLVFTFPENLKNIFEKEKNIFIIGKTARGTGLYLDGKPVQVSAFDHFGG